MMNTGKACYLCPIGCGSCTTDSAAFWTMVSAFLPTALSDVQTYITAEGSGTTVPAFDAGTVSNIEKESWKLAYLYYQSLIEMDGVSDPNIFMEKAVILYNTLVTTYGYEARLTLLATTYSNELSLPFTIAQVE